MNTFKVLAISCGAALVLAGCRESSENLSTAADTSNTTAVAQSDGPVASGDQWHSAYGIWVCDALVDPMAEFIAPQSHGTHTHGDGLIHIHPFTEAVAGKDATLVSFMSDAIEMLGGSPLTADQLGVPGGTTYREGKDRCDGGDATVSISVWRNAADAADGADPDAVLTENLDSLYFAADGEAYSIAFTADPASVPPPPSILNLASAGSDLSGDDLSGDDVPDAPITLDLSGPLAIRPVKAIDAPGACPRNGPDPSLYPQLGEGDDVIACYELTDDGVGEEVVASAEAVETGLGGWQVALTLTDEGIDAFNVVARACFDQSPACPTGRLAILIGSDVISAPSINAPSFEADQIFISGNFTESDARALAQYLQP